MKTKILSITAIIIGSALMLQPASAQVTWTLMDDLTTGHNPGDLAGQGAADGGNWVGMGGAGAVNIGTAAGTGGQAAVAAAGGTIDGADYLALPTLIVGGTTATVYFQFDIGSSATANNNINWAVENVTSATVDSSGAASGASDTTYLNANHPTRDLSARNGGSFVTMFNSVTTTAFVPVANTVYSAWMVINNPSASAPSYNIYMAGGALGSTAVEMGLGNATAFNGAMRNPSNGTTISNFVYGLGGTFTSSGNTGQALYDVWEANGIDTTSPTPAPEPSTFGLVGFSGGLLMLANRLRRRNGVR